MLTVLACGAVAAAVGVCCAGESLPAAEPPAVEPPGESRPALAGPTVREEEAAPRTLVVIGFDGAVRRPEKPVEFAAADLLQLNEQTRAAVDAIAVERALLLDAFVSANLDLLTQVETASNTGDTMGLLALGQRAWVETEPLRAGGPLSERVRAALPEGQRAAYDRLLLEYWAAVIAEGKRKPKPDGRTPGRFEIIAQERMESFGREVEQAFARVLVSGELVYRMLLDGIELRPEQAEKIRGMIADFIEEHGVDAPEKEWAVLGVGIAAHLSPEQMVRFAENVKKLR
jgi:hypothetical protein